MKRILIILVIVTLLLCACGKKEEEQTEQRFVIEGEIRGIHQLAEALKEALKE